MAVLHGRAGSLTTKNGGFRPGQSRSRTASSAAASSPAGRRAKPTLTLQLQGVSASRAARVMRPYDPAGSALRAATMHLEFSAPPCLKRLAFSIPAAINILILCRKPLPRRRTGRCAVAELGMGLRKLGLDNDQASVLLRQVRSRPQRPGLPAYHRHRGGISPGAPPPPLPGPVG
jgi:hypothetical protein